MSRPSRKFLEKCRWSGNTVLISVQHNGWHVTKEHVQKANKHTKSCSPSLAIKKMQIITTMRYDLHTYWNGSNGKCWQHWVLAMGNNMNSYASLGGRHMVEPLGKLSVISDKVQHTLTVGASNPLVGIYPKERERYVHTRTWTWGL